MKTNSIVIIGLICVFICTFLVIYTRWIAPRIKKIGWKNAIKLINIKFTAVLELAVPQTIWGDRVGIRSAKCTLNDAEIKKIYEWDRDEDLKRSWGGIPNELSLDSFRHLYHSRYWHPQTNSREFYIVIRSGELIGRIRLFSIDWIKNEGELGIFIDKGCWGKRYGPEAIKIFQQYFFSKTPINRIYLVTFKDNYRAQRTFIGCGFHMIGEETRFYPALNDYKENFRMEITRQDFFAHQQK